MTCNVYSHVKTIVIDKIDAGEEIVINLLAHEIVRDKDLIETPDSDFFRVSAYLHTKDVVKRVGVKSNNAKYVLDGFQHLQMSYTVTRRDQVVLIPVGDLAIEEIEARASELDAMASGCIAHAKELRHFALTLSSKAAA